MGIKIMMAMMTTIINSTSRTRRMMQQQTELHISGGVLSPDTDATFDVTILPRPWLRYLRVPPARGMASTLKITT
jgi:hypothetical protein